MRHNVTRGGRWVGWWDGGWVWNQWVAIVARWLHAIVVREGSMVPDSRKGDGDEPS